MTSPSFSLRPLTSADVDTCAQIAGLAFATDRQTQFKAADPSDPFNHVEGTEAGLKHSLKRPPGSAELTVAVDDATGEIIGSAVWASRGLVPKDGPAVKLNIDGVRGDAPPPDASYFDKSKTPREQLDAYTSHDLQTVFMGTLMPPGVRCMFIVGIAVHPSHQGKGVGKALIRKVTDRADAEGVCCWVHASEAGAPVFEKCGFKVIRRLELDLDEWNWKGFVPPEGEGARWGRHVLRYMLREPGKR
ncbi:hypothetical protein PRZ48_011718 [Zasmidium cellare]|uniref:N-acetyltransferase domain-containing protein n=1 Tax=Zasmidium cellare TaxID=395010 RepID=A0ABR0E749_ZASCE|nr:hypothetical protein PRZ48_011718 [Zasmidium cellare]